MQIFCELYFQIYFWNTNIFALWFECINYLNAQLRFEYKKCMWFDIPIQKFPDVGFINHSKPQNVAQLLMRLIAARRLNDSKDKRNTSYG